MAEEAVAESTEPSDGEAQDTGGHASALMHGLSCPASSLLSCVLHLCGT